ncbi:helix-turn-helix transcriptional regulator [Luedemannella helvata]|uniref:HTH luxR-type domain-containing protein n=1 Tax=Luedemannella helvata TaxID=349315 RepID=A0ABP4VX95_9ACTN
MTVEQWDGPRYPVGAGEVEQGDPGAPLRQLADLLRVAAATLEGALTVLGTQRPETVSRSAGSGPRDTAGHPATIDGWPSLTAAERVIAGMVGEALTNRQIASRLFVSPHTVNYHLRHIFRKLDITSRVQLAALVHASRQPGGR